MRTAYSPKSHRELSDVTVGEEYGHVPGHHYHDVDVVISERRGKYRCHVVESWGSSQGYDEEHGRREVIGRGDSIEAAADDARRESVSAGIECEYLVQAVSLSVDAAIEEAAKPGLREIIATVDDADFRDCVATGFRWSLYGDGHVSAEYVSRWQGSRCGERWVTEAGFVDLDDLDDSNPDANAEALLTAAVDSADPRDDSGWRQTSKGTIVR